MSLSDDSLARFCRDFFRFSSSCIGEVVGGEVERDWLIIESSLSDDELLEVDSERCLRAGMMVVVDKMEIRRVHGIIDYKLLFGSIDVFREHAGKPRRVYAISQNLCWRVNYND